ncbi:sulfotransferase [Mitsuaria sp. GD03876]|uniref:tetratricopeptide repeat-containing sulfotransferase family protein n=1 Tax=Mitsuaria sp. GD03876 TaxID=2975399 RepID=UPI00244A0A84|nr:sulfotransferase [Mitsuaria sp. GD03876]MDH0862993.1 sulfotransferase [Mitsuaria sp. GD03876]
MQDPVSPLRDAALDHLSAGRSTQAIAAYEALLRVTPGEPDDWFNLAWLQRSGRDFDGALASYDRARALGAEGPEEIHLNRAVILTEDLRREDEAMAELERALAIAPRFLPALVNLGNLHEQRGERAQAQRRYEEALAVEPGHALALSRLVNLRRFEAADDPLIQRLRQALGVRGRHPAEHADLAHALGKALDDAGAYDEAFAAYAHANQAARHAHGPRPLRYDRAAHEHLVDALIRQSRQPVPPSRDDAPAPSAFICGMFRSGSTLLEQILGSHPGATAGGEIDLLPALAQRHVLPPLSHPDQPLPAELAERMRREYRDGVALRFPGASLLTDKRPDNFLFIGLIKQLFPDAKILHTRRAVLDNCLSVFFLHLGPSMSYALDLEDIAHWYRQYRRLMAHWKSLYGDDIHDVDYDALVTDPRPQIERALAHVGLGWDDACLDFHASKSTVATPSNWQVRQPLYQRSSGRWRNYERHLGALRAALGEFADE